MRRATRRLIGWMFATFALSLPCGAGEKAVPGLSIGVAASTVGAKVLANPAYDAWHKLTSKRVALNRTPRLQESEPPSELEIPEAEVRVTRASGKLLVRLNWRDATQDAATLEAVPGTPYEGRFHKVQTGTTSRFFDAAAVMVPKKGGKAASPSLQMGDAQDPVTIYYWNAVRGAMVMEAQGRETTMRTGATFPAEAVYQGGEWTVVFELPDLPAGTPLAFAVWNGSQQDRDGRKYFSVWHWLE